ncbi:Prophage antirepressor [Fructobacillus cardui]|uniref:BRO family protein n=1 Tax=Fructobacillus cardui TaxID=2893170 RepID=UPI00200B99C6|nr:BRO family protein [Fructobacillus cardui]MCK8628144.1 ORF6C domain-containing protein [Fructobacillus cardui]CAK1244655.1 Prophage antirepressor [Fructobacillus cardui]
MNEVKAFNFESNEVRTVLIDNEPWFVGKDVAETLGYSQTAKAIRTHVEVDDKGVSVLDTPGGKQQMTVINESGVFALIFGSELDSAKRFKKWVTSEVLPSIRKTGSYSVQPMDDFDKIALIAQGTTKLKEQVHGIETKVDTYIENQVITATDSNAIARAVSKRVHQYGALHHIDRDERGPLFKDLNRQIKEVTGAGNRSRIKSKDYDMVIDFIENWEPTTATKMLMEQTA